MILPSERKRIFVSTLTEILEVSCLASATGRETGR